MPKKNNSDIDSRAAVQFPPAVKSAKVVLFFLSAAAVLLCLFGALFLGVVPAVIVAVVLLSAAAVSAFLGSSRRILKQIGAIKLNARIEPRLFGLLENLCLAAGVSIPEVYITDDDDCVNGLAIAMPAKKSALVFTTGVLSSLDRIELEAVVAAQVAALRRKEEKVSALAVKLMAIPSLIRPSSAAFLLRLTGANRAFFVDQTAVLLTKYPPGLYSALNKAASMKEVPERLQGYVLTLTGALWLVPVFRSRSESSVFAEMLSVEGRMQILTEM